MIKFPENGDLHNLLDYFSQLEDLLLCAYCTVNGISQMADHLKKMIVLTCGILLTWHRFTFSTDVVFSQPQIVHITSNQISNTPNWMFLNQRDTEVPFNIFSK